MLDSAARDTEIRKNVETFRKMSALLREVPHRQAFHAVILWLGSYILENYPDESDTEIETVTAMLRNGVEAGK